MKILLVTDQYYQANNGLTISIRRFAKVLSEHGNEVRILSFGKPEFLQDGETAYLLGKQKIPIFDKIVTDQGMVFAKPDNLVISKAVEWAEIIHITSPFITSHHVIKEANLLIGLSPLFSLRKPFNLSLAIPRILFIFDPSTPT